MFSGRRSYLDQIVGTRHPVESSDGRRDTLRTGYYFFDLSAKATYRPAPGHQISLVYYEGADDLDLRLPFDLSLTVDSWLRPSDLFFEIDQSWGNRVIVGKHRALLSPQTFITSTAYYSGYGARENAFVQPTSSSSLASSYDVQLDEFGYRLDLDRYWSLEHELRIGLHAAHRSFDSGLDARVTPTPGAEDVMEQESRLAGWEIAGYVQGRAVRGSRILLRRRGKCASSALYYGILQRHAKGHTARVSRSTRAVSTPAQGPLFLHVRSRVEPMDSCRQRRLALDQHAGSGGSRGPCFGRGFSSRGCILAECTGRSDSPGCLPH